MNSVYKGGVLGQLSAMFWNEQFWLPENMTWVDLESTEHTRYPEIGDIYISFLLGVVVLPIRYLLESFLLAPIGVRFGVKINRTKKIIPNQKLEDAFKQNGRIKHKEIQGLAKQLDMSERQVERWFRLRKGTSSSQIRKFSESSWRFSYYLGAFIYGCWCLSDKPWLYDVNRCWDNYPHQPISEDVRVYYIIELGLYWSLLFSQCVDTKRKDFWEMVMHHITTIALLSFSWICNLTRVGTLILLLHDVGDVFLEAAKAAKYLNKQKVCDALFGLFTLVWFITRLGIFPFRIIYNTFFETTKIVPPFPGYYFFNFLLAILQVLHVIWSYLILRIVVNTIYAGKMERDIRSDTESDSSTDKAHKH